MIIRKNERIVDSRVRFDGRGEVAMTAILPPQSDLLAGKGRVFSEVVLRPGEKFGCHTHHGEFEVMLIIGGVGIAHENGTQKTVYPGDVCICRDGEEHGMENAGTEDLRYVALVLYS